VASVPAGFGRLLWIGPVAFFIAACAASVLDVEYSADTWIGLAAGRHLQAHLDWGRFWQTFPLLDPFSYTFFQQPWVNQNWFASLGYYRIYERYGPSAVVHVTWALAALVHVCVLAAVYLRTRSWLAAWLAAGVAALGMRDFLEPRAAIAGLTCAAVLWMLLCAVEGQRERRRWWPLVPLLPLLIAWSASHGGFVFGCGVLALYCLHWVFARALRLPRAAGGGQILCIAAILGAAVTLAVALGPYGLRGITHTATIASSSVFRSVTEWQPAWFRIGEEFPPMWRFWGIVAGTAGGLLLLGIAARVAGRRGAPDGGLPPWSLFDAGMVVVTFWMALSARRFAPLFYVISAPVIAIWVMRLVAPLAPRWRDGARPALMVAAGLAAVVLGALTWTAAQRQIVEAYRDQPGADLLDRTRGNALLREAAAFLAEHRMRVRLYTDYGDAALVLFYAPDTRVYIDPRSEQVYSEEHFQRYLALQDAGAPAERLRRGLDASATDAVLLRKARRTRVLQDLLLDAPEWVPVFHNTGYALFLRRGSPALARLEAIERARPERRPAPGPRE